MVYNNNRVISTDKKSESSSTGSNSTTTTGKMCSANTPIVPYNLRKHATTTATTTMASAIVASAPRRTTTRTLAATTASKPPVSAATKTATTKPTTATKPATNSTNKPVTTRSNKPSTTASSSSSSAAIKKLCFERQSTLISSSVDNDTTVVNDITVVEKKIDDKKKKKRASPLTLASSKLSGYEEEDDDDDDDDDVEEIKKEFKQPPKPQPAVVGKNTTRKAPPNKKLRKLRLCDTPHTPKTLMKKSSFDLLTPKTSTNDRVVSPVAASSVFGEKLTKSTISVPLRMKPLPSQHISDAAAKLSAVKQALTANFVDDVEMILMETTVGDEDGLRRRELQPTKTPARPPRYQSRFTPKNLQPKQALTFDDSDNESSSSTNSITVSSSAQTTTTNREEMNFMSSDEMTLKRLRVTSESSSNGAGIFSHQRQSSLQSMFNVMKTPAPTSSSSAIHASINPFTPPGGGAASTTSSREVSLVRVAAANYSAVKQKASSLAALSTTAATTEVESARMPIRKCLVSRYHQEFHEVCKLGSGEFGDVFKCINRLDGCTYAIKRSKLAIAGSALEVAAWKEVCAHAVLVKHNHIVQYYSAWAEMDRMLIQNEYCNGGSLAEFLDTLRLSNMHTTNTATSAGLLSLPPSPSPSCSSSTSSNPSSAIMSECDLKTLLLHVAKGLSYMHSLHLAHLDIKPGNIFICRSPRRQQMHSSLQQSSMKGVGGSLTSTTTTTTTMEGLVGTSSSSALLVSNEESGIESDDLDESETESTTSSVLSSSSSVFSDIITYKIGDLGHVTSTLHENPHVEEGDCRYLPNEILQENYSWLVKADVFALALTVFVAGSLEDLPKNGDEWHWIRQGNLKDLPQCSDRFKKLLQQMIHEDPSQRPSASTLVHHPCICPDSTKSKSQLRKELNQEKFKNEMLQRKVKKYEEQIHKLDSPLNPVALLGSNRCLNPIDSEQSKSNPKLARSLSSTLL